MLQKLRRKALASSENLTASHQRYNESVSDRLILSDSGEENMFDNTRPKIVLAREPAALDNASFRRPPRQNASHINAFQAIRKTRSKLPPLPNAPKAPPAPPMSSRYRANDSSDGSNISDQTDFRDMPRFESDDQRHEIMTETAASSAVLISRTGTEIHEDPVTVHSANSNLFQDELVQDIRPVLGQTKAGVDMSARVAMFIDDIADLQHSFANRLNQIIESEMIRFTVHTQTDGMDGVREMWLQAVQDSRAWASCAKDMAVNLNKMCEPLKKQVKSAQDSVAHIVAENDRLAKPLPDLQSSIAKRQIKCNKLLAPLLNPDFRGASQKVQERKILKARPQVIKYLDELYNANEWLNKVQTVTRPRMLSVMQRLEEQRIESTRRSLLRYVSLLKSSSKVMYKTSIAVEERLSRYHVEDDINAFVEAIRARPKVESECFTPFVYRLPVSMYELNIQHKLENQIRRFRGLERNNSIIESPKSFHALSLQVQESHDLDDSEQRENKFSFC